MIGSVVAGRYEVSALLHESAIFSLFRAKDRITGRDVSLRLVRSPFDGQTDFLGALEAAVRKVSGITHPNVERLFELDQYEGQSYIIGEWTQAPALADRIRKLAPFSVPVAVAAAMSVCRGLEAFHKAGVVHGDVGPDTACLMADGEVRLQMGGLWEAYGYSPTAGAVVLPALAPALAPEVGKGAMPTLQSDVYAVGVLLYELLTGRKPYVGDTPLATAMRHTTEETPRVRDLNPSVPIVLEEIVAKAMDKDPAGRYATAGEMAADLRLVQDALRFGRTLAWPLRPVAASAPPAKTSGRRTPQAAPPGRAAPRMSAIREDDREDEYGKIERDVPAWASLGLALVMCVAVSLLAVYFVLNLNRPRMVSVPEAKRMAFSEARESFSKQKLELHLERRVASNEIEADRILSTDPPSGTRVRENSTVTAIVSAGPSEVTIPELTGMTPDQARSRLEELGLALDEDLLKVNRENTKAGTILAQEPKSQSKVVRGTKIKATVQDPSLPIEQIQKYEYTMNVSLVDLTQREEVSVEIEDVDGVRVISKQSRGPGENFQVKATARGEQATFRIKYGDRLVKTVVKRSDGTEPEPTN